MAKDRARDVKRSVGSHEKMMSALGRAAGWKRYPTIDYNKSGITADLAIHEKGNWVGGPKKAFGPGEGHVQIQDIVPAEILSNKQGILTRKFNS